MFEQERMIGRLQRRVADEPEIVACFMSGSYGRHADDAYSDLDLTLIFSDERERERIWADRERFSQSIMPYVPLKSFDAIHIRPFFHIVLFANGSKLDLRFETQDSLLPNPWDSQIRILKDSDGWAESFQITSERQTKPQPTITNKELTALDQRFWVMFWDVLRLLARGDVDKPFPVYLQLLHFSFPPLLRALPLDATARVNLIEAHYSQDATVTSKHITDLLNVYLEARAAITKRYHLQFYPDQSFESQIIRLVKRIV